MAHKESYAGISKESADPKLDSTLSWLDDIINDWYVEAVTNALYDSIRELKKYLSDAGYSIKDIEAVTKDRIVKDILRFPEFQDVRFDVELAVDEIFD